MLLPLPARLPSMTCLLKDRPGGFARCLVTGFSVFIGLGSAACGGESTESPSAEGARPNIVVILADDMGYSDVGCYGGEIETPVLDQLAAKGVKFSQFYNASRCCPTRASLLTGLYSHQAGMGFMVSHRPSQAAEREASYRGYLSTHCATIAELLGSAGYNTLMAGKWHVGEYRPHWPLDRGFNKYFGLISGACSYWEVLPGREMALMNETWTPDEDDDSFYMTDAFTDYAIRFVDQSVAADRSQPFFLYLAYTAPHWPLHAPPEDIAKYRGAYDMGWDELRRQRYRRQVELGLIEPGWKLSPRDRRVPAWEDIEDKRHQAHLMALYAAVVDRMDQNIGRLMETLTRLDVADNTLVMFLSDNGGCQTTPDKGDPDATPGAKGSYPSYGYGWANASNTPFRWFKQYVHEAGVATPLICYWPRGIRRPGRIAHRPGHVIDIMATCLDLAGADYPERRAGHALTPLEGTSFAPVLADEPAPPSEAMFFEHMGSLAVRQGKWKLVGNRHDRRWELYDLDADRTELTNVADQMPQRVAAMEKLWLEWAEKVGARTSWIPPRPGS